ncbi:MAG: adenine phosphoribosyltransferase [Candidatus Micrarchaeia archaeon]
MAIEAQLKEKIRSIKDYPKKGVVFRDITPLLRDSDLFGRCVDALSNSFSGEKIDYVAGIEARGFIVGAPLAMKINAGFVPIRKSGKLPYEKVSKSYSLEYGNETLEVHKDAVEKGSRVLIVDDLLATGGSSSTAASLIESIGGNVVGFAFIIELESLNGRAKLGGRKIVSLVKF